jgi:hypothetical protein
MHVVFLLRQASCQFPVVIGLDGVSSPQVHLAVALNQYHVRACPWQEGFGGLIKSKSVATMV